MGYPNQDDSLSFDKLREANVKRCNRDFPGNHLKNWSANDWMTALVGEVGELANILKKIHRGYDLTKGMDEATLREEAAKELGDIQCYLDLLAEKLGVDLGAATRKKFNEVSERVNSNIFL